MPRVETVPTHKVLVQCVSVTPNGRCRVGRHWPLGATEAELTDEDIDKLKKDISYEFAPGKRADKAAAAKRVNFIVSVLESNVGEREVVRPDVVPALSQPELHHAATEAHLVARAALERVDSMAQSLEAERRARAEAESKNAELNKKLEALLALPTLATLLTQATAPVKVEEERLPSIPTAEELAAPAPAKSKGK